MFGKKRTYKLTLPGDKKDESPSRDDEKLISRRLLLMRGAVGFGFAALAGKLWQMQIARGTEFQEVAEDNVLKFERIKAARGKIVDREGRTLAENRRAWTVRIIPSRLPEDDTERQRVLDSLAAMLDLKHALVLDRSLVPLGSESAVVNALERRLDVDGDRIAVELNRDYIALVMVRDELSLEEANRLHGDLSDIPGLRVLNLLDFQLENHATSDQPMVVKADVDRDTALSIGANALHLPGVTVDDEALVRRYTVGQSFSHILGYVGPISQEEYEAATTVTGTAIYDPDDVVGRGGVEEALEQELRGTKGARWVQVDSDGVERFELLDRRREPVPGLSAQLTIDREFQIEVEQALRDGIEFANKELQVEGHEPVTAGVAVVINPKNGDLLAMSSLPAFDSQQFVDGMSEEAYSALINDPDTPLLNRAISGTYAPGSTFKPLIAAIGLQEGVIDTQKTFECAGEFRVPWSWDESQGNDYFCWIGRPGHGPVDIYKAIADSCDVYFYNVGAPRDKPDEEDFPNADWLHYYNPGDPEPHYFYGLGIDRIARYLTNEFAFGMRSGIELAGEAEGVVPTPAWLRQTFDDQFWSVGDTINVSIGQGHLLCTPLQLANATAAIANRGTLWRPRVVRALLREDGRVVREFLPREIKKMDISPEHLETVRQGMRLTITEGTGAQVITIQDPPVGGKSGTAEFGIAVDGRYAQSHAWFSAFGPYDDPEICVAVLIVSGQIGSTYAGPVVNRILESYFSRQT